MTEKNEEDFENKIICRFCEKEILSDKVRDHCHTTGKYRGSAHSIRNFKKTQKNKVRLYHLYFTTLAIMIDICSPRD